MPRVCVIGSANLDFTVALPRLPRRGETVAGGTLGVSGNLKWPNRHGRTKAVPYCHRLPKSR